MYKIIDDINVITNNPIFVNNWLYPTNVGIAPTNNANVSSPNAKPLLLSKILLKHISVIGIVILNNKIAIIPITGFVNENIKQMADIKRDIEIFSNPILSPIIPPNIFPNTTPNTDNRAKINVDFQANDNIIPT